MDNSPQDLARLTGREPAAGERVVEVLVCWEDPEGRGEEGGLTAESPMTGLSGEDVVTREPITEEPPEGVPELGPGRSRGKETKTKRVCSCAHRRRR